MAKPSTLNDFCALIVDCRNRTPPPAREGETPVGRAIGTPDIDNGRIVLDGAHWVSQDTYDAWTARAIPQADDIVLTREAPVGRVGRVEPDMNICLGQRTMLLRPDPGKVDPRYLQYLLLSPRLQAALHSRASGSTVSHLRVGQVRELPMPEIPALPAQRAVAEVLGALDDKIAVNRSVAATSLQLGEALLEKAVHTAPRTTTVGEVAELVYGKALPEPRRLPGDSPVYGCTGQVGWHNTALTTSAAPVVGRKGANAGHVSWMSRPGWVIDTAFYARPSAPGVPPEALYFILRSAGLKTLIGDSAVPGVNRDLALRRHVLVPAQRLMPRFGEESRQLVNTSVHLQAENRTLSALRDTLLPRLVTGELRIRDAERTVAEAL